MWPLHKYFSSPPDHSNKWIKWQTNGHRKIKIWPRSDIGKTSHLKLESLPEVIWVVSNPKIMTTYNLPPRVSVAPSDRWLWNYTGPGQTHGHICLNTHQPRLNILFFTGWKSRLLNKQFYTIDSKTSQIHDSQLPISIYIYFVPQVHLMNSSDKTLITA